MSSMVVRYLLRLGEGHTYFIFPGRQRETMEFRSASPSDAKDIYEVQAQSCRSAYYDVLDDHSIIDAMEDPSTIDQIQEWLEYTVDDDQAIHPVAVTDKDGIVGFAQLLVGEHAPDRTSSNEAFLQSLYVQPDYWGRGIGSELLETGVKRLPSDATTVSLEVLPQNDIGVSFYEKHNFERESTGEFEAGGTTYETVIFSRAVTR
ncbi:hypothetical protein B1756_16770 [Natrarchaeobaculum aegyptiacum]|uniref:N-acetyltransferase domain-containing protein n=2 Tax=Natrarchaeobaculum aegyptiacum TaxID=745377 RepID=A0A2Z2HZ66_9EURY|nr:hypothetical protein B1756_16770 [Natrarchaeobaculum aegyptiacum]